MQDHTLGGVEGDGHGLGHRVGGGDELHLARADAYSLTVLHRYERRLLTQSGFLHPMPGQADGQLGAVNGSLQVAQQVGQAPGVILMPMGEDDPVHLVGSLPQVGELGEDQVDPGHIGIGEHDPAVENDDAAVDLNTGTVAPDFPETSKKDNSDRLGGGACG
jgi:hypothetical protein